MEIGKLAALLKPIGSRLKATIKWMDANKLRGRVEEPTWNPAFS